MLPVFAAAQGNAFNFQGRLNDGTNPANGSYDLQFRLFNAITGGNPVGTVAERPNTPLINGVFSVNLDFGATAFNSPNAVFIEIAVKPSASANAFTVLGPRQQLTVVPFAVRANNATNADNSTNSVNSQNAVNSVNSQNAQNANTLNGLGSSDFIRNSVAPIANQNFNIVGNGVINGTLYVAGATTIGSPTITSNLSVSGNIATAGVATQPSNKGGFVKAMLFADENGVIQRCYNGVTGASTGNCGITISHPNAGIYDVDFPFPITDRFYSVTAEAGSTVTLTASFATFPTLNSIRVFINITDIDHVGSRTDGDFMLIVY